MQQQLQGEFIFNLIMSGFDLDILLLCGAIVSIHWYHIGNELVVER